MNYQEKLTKAYTTFNSLVCYGLDPVVEEIPFSNGSIRKKIIRFYKSISDVMFKKNVFPSAVKPNFAFYAQYGIEGLEALLEIIRLFKEAGFPVILDVKRGDVEQTARAYAREAFEFFQSDAVTLSPYLGYDAVSPFTENYPDRGYYILNKTSNKSSAEIQDIDCNGKPYYMHIAGKIVEWHKPGLGAVIGATFPEQLKRISDFFQASGKNIPLLIPGIGAQGGSLEEVCKVLFSYANPGIHRINVSRTISHAYKKHTHLDFAEAAVLSLQDLNLQVETLKANFQSR